MNTTKKGDKLEDRIFDLFEEDISKGQFIAPKDQCKIYKKKGYYSKDREKNIIFDVSIEIFLPGHESYSILYIIECKNYNHPVPVDDVEELFAKVQQISGANIKAVIVSSNSFQEGAFKFSKSKGIGLVRYFERDSLEWVLSRSPSSLISRNYAIREWENAYSGLHYELFKSNYFDFYGYVDGNYTNSVSLFMSDLAMLGQSDDKKEELSFLEIEKDAWQVKYIEESDIEDICKIIRNNIGYKFGEVSLEDLCEFLREEYDLTVKMDADLENGILGEINFETLEIQISKNNESKARKRFTLAHEIGHFLLGHSEYMLQEKCLESAIDLEDPPKIGIRDIMRMEWQANQFASCLLLPKSEFLQTFTSVALRNGLRNRGFGVLYVDNQKCNQDNYHKVTSPLMKRYGVSRAVVKIRLKKLGFINELNK